MKNPNDAADQLLREGRWGKAMVALERRAEAGGGVPDLLQAAYAAADGELWSDAERLLKKVIELAPDCTDAYVKIGLVFENLERLAEARTMLERALELEERQSVLTLLGSVQRRLGDDAAAIATLRRSVALNPNDDEGHHALALALLETDPMQAVEHFRQALALDPNHPYAHREMGKALWKAHRFDEAIEAVRQAVQLDDADSWAHSYLGSLLEIQGHSKDAQREFLRASELDPGNGYFWANLGSVTTALGEYAQAETYLRKGLSVELHEAILYREYGVLLKKIGHLSKARRYLKRALRLNPNNKQTQRLLADLEGGT